MYNDGHEQMVAIYQFYHAKKHLPERLVMHSTYELVSFLVACTRTARIASSVASSECAKPLPHASRKLPTTIKLLGF